MIATTILIHKTGREYAIPPASELPESSQRYVWEYGLGQCVNDAASSVLRRDFPKGETGDAEFAIAVHAKTDFRRDQILSGNVPGARSVDTTAAKVRAAAAAAGVDLAKIDPTALANMFAALAAGADESGDTAVAA